MISEVMPLNLSMKDHPFIENKKDKHYNYPPPNFYEMTEEEFSQCNKTLYSIIYIEHRQITERHCPAHINCKGLLDLHMFWIYDKSGWGMARDYHNRRIRYFVFAVCEHEYTRETIANCLHEDTCIKCGFKTTVDTSG